MKRNLSSTDRQLQSRKWVSDNSFMLTTGLGLVAATLTFVGSAKLLIRDPDATIAGSYWTRFLNWYGTQPGGSLLKTFHFNPTAQDIQLATDFFKRNDMLLNVVIALSLIAFCATVFFLFKLKADQMPYVKTQSDEKDLVSVSQLKSEIKTASKRKDSEFVKSHFDFVVPKLKLRIPDRSLASMLGVVGGAGSGKTNFISQFVQSRREMDCKSLIVDINGEYHAKFGRPQDVILSLYDVRAAFWDLWQEDIPSSDVAEAIMGIGDDTKSQGSQEFFNDAGHAVLKTFLDRTRKAEDLWELIQKPHRELMAFLKKGGGIAPQLLGSETSGQTAGVLASAVKNLSFFEHLNVHAKNRKEGREPFSITQWVKNDPDKRWVYLVCTEETLAQTRRLLRLWFFIACRAISARPENKRKERIYFVCDELATFGTLPRLSNFLTTARKRNARAVLGFQSTSQLQHLYGQHETQTILQGLQNFAVFRCADSNVARLMSERLGKIEVLEAAYSHAQDLKSGRYQASISERVRDKFVVSANTIMNLEIGHAILCLSEFSPCKVQFARVDHPSVGETAQCYTDVLKSTLKIPEPEPEILTAGIKKVVEKLPVKSAQPSPQNAEDEIRKEAAGIELAD